MLFAVGLNFLAIKLIGLDSDTATRILLTAGVACAVLVVRLVLLLGIAALRGTREHDRPVFWARQVSSLVVAERPRRRAHSGGEYYPGDFRNSAALADPGAALKTSARSAVM